MDAQGNQHSYSIAHYKNNNSMTNSAELAQDKHSSPLTSTSNSFVMATLHKATNSIYILFCKK